MANIYTSPTYLRRYQLLNKSEYNGFGSRPENLICMKDEMDSRVAITVIYNEERKWLKIIKYSIVFEDGQPYFDVLLPPVSNSPGPFGYEQYESQYWITPHRDVQSFGL